MGDCVRTEFTRILEHVAEHVLFDCRVDSRSPNLSKAVRKSVGSREDGDPSPARASACVPLQDRIHLLPTVDSQ
jgi:hypothetical protein